MKRNLFACTTLSTAAAVMLITQPVIAAPTEAVVQEQEISAQESPVEENISANESEEYDPIEDDPLNGYATYQEYLDSIRQETLSDAQIQAGYTLNQYGIAVPPEDQGGGDKDEGAIIMGGVQASATTASITFAGKLPTGVHSNIYLRVLNLNTYSAYGVILYENQNLSTTINLPDGDYLIESGGVMGDNDQKYSLDGTRFKVKAGEAKVIDIKIEDPAGASNTAEEIVSQEGTVAETVSNETAGISLTTSSIEADQTNGKSQIVQTVVYIFITLLTTLVPLALIFAWYQKHRNRPRGFNE